MMKIDQEAILLRRVKADVSLITNIICLRLNLCDPMILSQKTERWEGVKIKAIILNRIYMKEREDDAQDLPLLLQC